MRQDYLAKQKQWEQEQARTAPEIPPSLVEEDSRTGALVLAGKNLEQHRKMRR